MRAVLCVCLCGCALARADTLEFKDGRVIHGTFESADRTHIRFRQDHSRHTDVIARSRVAHVSFEVDSGKSTPVGTVAATPPPPMAVVTPQPSSSSASIRASGNIVPAGTAIMVRVADPLQLNASQIGNTIQGTLEQPIVVNGTTIAPAGSTATLQVTGIAGGNRLTETGDIMLQLMNFTGSTGQTYNTVTSEAVVADPSHTVLRGQHIQVRPGALLSFTLQQNVVL